jgi:hypothetical protein
MRHGLSNLGNNGNSPMERAKACFMITVAIMILQQVTHTKIIKLWLAIYLNVVCLFMFPSFVIWRPPRAKVGPQQHTKTEQEATQWCQSGPKMTHQNGTRCSTKQLSGVKNDAKMSHKETKKSHNGAKVDPQ